MQKFRYWAERNPRELEERPLHTPPVTVWCAVAVFGVIGPYVYWEGDTTVTVTDDRYVQMLDAFLRPKLDDEFIENVWFNQDGATAHTPRRLFGVLREIFPGHLISLRGDVK